MVENWLAIAWSNNDVETMKSLNYTFQKLIDEQVRRDLHESSRRNSSSIRNV
jgi:hypothetical protein